MLCVFDSAKLIGKTFGHCLNLPVANMIVDTHTYRVYTVQVLYIALTKCLSIDPHCTELFYC